MSKIEDLIAQYCPDGVEFRPLSELVNILDSKRKPISKSNRVSGSYPYYGANGIQDYVDGYLFDGEFLLLGEDGSVINKDGSPVLNWASGKIWVNNHAHILSEKRSEALLRYLFFALSELDVTKVVKGNIPKITQQNLRGFQIPIPPLPVQEEIVSILDKFTALEAELEAELEARTRQYEYYRNELLSFDGKDVEWKALGNISKCYAGATPKTSIKEYWEGGNIPWMSSGEVNLGNVFSTEKFITQLGFDNSSTKMIPKDSVVIALAGQGKTRGMVGITRIELCTNQSLCAVVVNEGLNSDYLYYFLKTQYKQLRNVSSGDGTRGGLNLQMIRDYKIPVPPIEEQERIVAILDKFDALVNDISTGLPAEIQARRQQYEYYRGKLLTFEPLTA